MNQRPKPIKVSRASPPRTPPTMAPTGAEDFEEESGPDDELGSADEVISWVLLSPVVPVSAVNSPSELVGSEVDSTDVSMVAETPSRFWYMVTSISFVVQNG